MRISIISWELWNIVLSDLRMKFLISRLQCHYHETLPENPAGLTAVPVEVKHALDMKCYGYVLSNGTESIYYSGDSSELPEDIRNRFLAGEINRIYHDTSTHDSPNPSHCYYGKMEKWIPREERHRVYCMHLDSQIGRAHV